MSSLKEKANNILSDKSTNLLPENIKQDITVLGVTGTLPEHKDSLLTGHRISSISSNFNAIWEDCFMICSLQGGHSAYQLSQNVLCIINGIVKYDKTEGMNDYNIIENWTLSFQNDNGDELYTFTLSDYTPISTNLWRNNFARGFSADSYTIFCINSGSYDMWKQAGFENDLSQITKLVITDTTL